MKRFIKSMLMVLLVIGFLFCAACNKTDNQLQKLQGKYFCGSFQADLTQSENRENGGLFELSINGRTSVQSFDVINNLIYVNSFGLDVVGGTVLSKSKIAIRVCTINANNLSKWHDAYVGSFPEGDKFNTIIKEDPTDTWCITYEFSSNGTVEYYLVNKSGEKYGKLNGSYKREQNIIILTFPSSTIHNCSFMVVDGSIYECHIYEKL